MATVRLPDDPSFEQLRKQAKDLRDQARSGTSDALALVGAHHPDGPHPPSLAGAQLVIARRHGFPSWAALKRHVQTIQRYRRVPDQVDTATSHADEFLLLACLRYGHDDEPARWRRAAALLAAHPGLTTTSVHAAAAAADIDALAGLLAADPTLAAAEGGPFAWEPILYLAYARHAPTIPADAVVRAARMLLDHGADPNAGYLWHGLTSPFTALAGALGGGERGQPAHPAADALARTLLSAGADPNDAQALYNRQFGSDDDHLRLLIDHGLGHGGGPWRTRLGDAIPRPADLIAGQLWWAVAHDLADRVRLLAECADLRAVFRIPDGSPAHLRVWNGSTPARLAALCGSTQVLEYLGAYGAPWSTADGVDALIAAALAGDCATVERLRGHAGTARRQRPGLIVWAAARRSWRAVPLLAELGFDVNALGRGDAPLEQPWETPLHQAAAADDVTGARLLIGLGADPNIRDTRFGNTPLGWAEHFRHTEVAHFLRPLTSQ
ncbi:ankyrin repeat domain-containing protein [Streptacidiphilus griseoplanus]|uniref:ankyrin repeat domain-containing protein n=1 Tax=Peterkaempfera griseoplana TaxID=66896 RepID=UPI0006E23597|nr:ankyrin repeat domain-containing protein [Peterkaempfera griseoplana]